MESQKPVISMIHYSAPPVIGGVEAVIAAHSRLFLQNGFPVKVVAGKGERDALPPGAALDLIPELDSQDAHNLALSAVLESGQIPAGFDEQVALLEGKLGAALADVDVWIIHNLFTKHFNLAATAALRNLVNHYRPRRAIAWCHDFTWTSPNSAHKVFPSYPWDILRTPQAGIRYVTVSAARQRELARLFDTSPDQIEVVYNGVDPEVLLGLSPQVMELAQALGLFKSDLNLLMPVRVTQAKNIEFAVRLLAAIRKHRPDAHAIVTGPPDPHEALSMAYFAELKALRREWGLENSFHFLADEGRGSLDLRQVGELYRLSDLVLLPSHREGFGMPLLEAGLMGIPVASAAIPAAVEIGKEDIFVLDLSAEPEAVASDLLSWLEGQPQSRLKRRVRRALTWQAIFRAQILPLALTR